MKNQKTKNQILQVLLKNPLEFWEVINKIDYISLEDFSNKELIDKIKDSTFNDLFQGLSNDDINDINEIFEKEVKTIKDWILNSKIRIKTFYYIGKLGPITASEIAVKIDKHPKSVSTYINELCNVKGWIELCPPDKDRRAKRYNLKEIGSSYYNLGDTKGWFNFIRAEELSIESTILKIYYIDWGIIDLDDETGRPTEKIEEVPYKSFPEIDALIMNIEEIADKIIKKLKVNITLPNLGEFEYQGVIYRHNLISIDSVDEDELAIIFASINYLKDNPFYAPAWNKKVSDGDSYFIPEISNIKLITTNSFFDENFPYGEDEGFLSEEETKKFISKTLSNFRKKYEVV